MNIKTTLNTLKNTTVVIALGIGLAAGITFAANTTWQETTWVTDGSVISASKIKTNFDYLYEQVNTNSNGTNIASNLSVEVDYSTCYSAPDQGASGNTANPWGYMNNTNFACTNNSVLVGMDSGGVNNVVCCKVKIVSN